ncbi:tryptophan synthase subunit alpha [Spelaeicoccus albus]|uniref:Tryptophan synthase alpha chain n=1 Tax=Spelaeicoccus albus TaxID=1280376 RepID=A0A7Z0D483_9MICO|nr:tryptophan synthase subunit alpha [Spelaeicoccus albus]NYI68580.1 tryptophan synthase alpha chain [Spelaeicoccus albus]
MSIRTAEAIDAARAAGRDAALIGYLPAGFPDVDTSIEAAVALARAGADIVEIGLPYSDPGMDGPVIQHAAEQALAGGVRTSDVLRVVEAVAATGAAAVVMTYYNPVLRYGVKSFARDLAAAGGAGLITPDLIPEEAGEWMAASRDHDLDRIFLVAPSSTPERLALTARAASGFVYAASTMGVTGTRATVDSEAKRLVADTKAAGAERVCVGLGVSTAEQAREVASFADGVIVGSALVRSLGADGVAAMASVAGELIAGLSTSEDTSAH